MKVIDGRNDHAIPTTLSEEQFMKLAPTHVASYSTEWASATTAHIYYINGLYVAATMNNNTLILCGEWKTHKGALNWVKRFYEHATQIY